jgi:tight adherence protein C
MIALLMVIGILLVGMSAWLTVRVVAFPRIRVEGHLRHIESYGFANPQSEESEPELQGVLAARLGPAAIALGAQLMAKVPRVPALSRTQLNAAGIYQLTVEAVHGYRGIAAISAPSLIILFSVIGGGLSIPVVMCALTLALAAWEGPAVLIRRRGRIRLDRIDRALPQLVDLLVATVEAGVGFAAALSSVGASFRGPLGDEVRLTLQQQQLGVSTERALGELALRCDTAFVRAFVRTVVRAESQGSSIGPVMRHLASDIRQRRRDAAREKIQKAPIKLLFPLLVFILLPLMLVVFFPAAYNLLHVLRSTS